MVKNFFLADPWPEHVLFIPPHASVCRYHPGAGQHALAGPPGQGQVLPGLAPQLIVGGLHQRAGCAQAGVTPHPPDSRDARIGYLYTLCTMEWCSGGVSTGRSFGWHLYAVQRTAQKLLQTYNCPSVIMQLLARLTVE